MGIRKFTYIITTILLSITITAGVFSGCTKYGKGFLSPYMQYAVSEFGVVRGRTATSYSMITDGSSVPLRIKWTHVYDSLGHSADDLFNKQYPVGVWTAAYNPLTDTNFATISAKRTVQNLQPIVINEKSGTLEANSGTIYLPTGTYTMDMEVSNEAGTETLNRIMQIVIKDGKPLETSPETGAFSNSLLFANTPTGKGTLFNGANNPFDLVTVTRFADTPNVLILKVTDRNGVPFNPKAGEFAKRPNSGLNPQPPFLQNLQDYAPDTYVASDTAISIKYPLVPFPIVSLGNGFNMYYRIPAQYVHIDSTSSWSANTAGKYYAGSTDSHYLGVYKDNLYDYSLRIPMRIQVPGAYQINVRILNTTHR
ncbi:DUF5007 domain-containing protein [Niastella vici]|nr:DUF5007 domain-containing protein [Niastella vici]